MKINRTLALGATSLVLAAGSGVLIATTAFGTGSQSPPTQTVTISVENGTTGPAGPAGPPGPQGDTGPAGPAGGLECYTGFSPGILVINHPGGQTRIYTCIEDKP